ncbi:hypothetical protein ACFLXU_00890 [Chloroflexota bacterium]
MPTEPVDLQEQSDCYQVAFEVLLGQPWLAGIFWFEWFADQSVFPSGPNDKEFVPYGKPAEDVIKKFYLSQ